MSFFASIAAPLIARGFSIIPLEPKGKAPASKVFGATARSNSKFDTDRWTVLFPDANVGICADEDFLVLETDDETRLRELCRNITGKELPITFTVQARPGRPHFYFRQTQKSLDVGNCAVEGLFEIRSRNQYVVGPGSIHPTGAIYQVTADYEILPIPGWLLDFLLHLKGETVVRPKSDGSLPEGYQLGEGEGRHYLLISSAARLWDGKKDFDTLFGEVWAINEAACAPPRDEAHVRSIVSWAMEQEPNAKGPTVKIGGAWGQDIRDLFVKDIPPRHALMQADTGAPLLYESSLNQVFAWRGLGKTAFALGLTKALVTGGTFLKYTAPHPVRVLYVDGELPLSQLKERCLEFVGEVPTGMLTYINPEDLPNKQIPNLSKFENQEKILNALAEHESQVVIFDSLSTLFHMETNDEEAWVSLANFFMQLRHSGYCVLLLHHAGKNGTQRGHSRGDDLLDVSIKLDKLRDWEPGMGLAFTLKYEKVRHGGVLVGFDATYTDGQWLMEVSESGARAEAEEMLRTGKSIRAVEKETGLSHSQVRTVKKKIEAGQLEILNDKAKKGGKQ